MPPVIYFIGIGGIGMSALARYFKVNGAQVSGYDRTETALTKELSQQGIEVHYDDNIALAPKNPQLVVYTPAIPADHSELLYYRDNNFLVVKRSDVLQAISASTFNICIAGTHGKTSISTMVAHILRHTGYGCNAFLGGISVNYQSNFWSTESSEGAANAVSVIEADEYDRSFHKLSPDIAVISSMDPDHLDIYGTEDAMQDAFVTFGNKIKSGGCLISKFGLPRMGEINVANRYSYSLQNDAADYYGANITIQGGGYVFGVCYGEKNIGNLKLNVGGMHNVENMVAAVAIADQLNIDVDKIREAVAAYQGVRRRFEYAIAPEPTSEGAYVKPVLIDDYAHHPEELKALLKSVRSLFPQRIVTVVFQPHLFTRTRDLADGFAASLSIADRVILLPVYPAREQPIEGVNSGLILTKLTVNDKYLLSRTEFIRWLQDHVKSIDKEFGEVFVMAGAGDIDNLVEPVKNILQESV